MSRRLPSKKTLLDQLGVTEGPPDTPLRPDQEIALQARTQLLQYIHHDVRWWYRQARRLALVRKPGGAALEANESKGRNAYARADMVKFILSRIAPEPREWSLPTAGAPTIAKKFAIHFHGVAPVKPTDAAQQARRVAAEVVDADGKR